MQQQKLTDCVLGGNRTLSWSYVRGLVKMLIFFLYQTSMNYPAVLTVQIIYQINHTCFQHQIRKCLHDEDRQLFDILQNNAMCGPRNKTEMANYLEGRTRRGIHIVQREQLLMGIVSNLLQNYKYPLNHVHVW